MIHVGGADYYLGGADELSEKSEAGDGPDNADEPDDDERSSSSTDRMYISDRYINWVCVYV